ncbi:hypothetical protein BM221_009460 [Beauveria bassiana]|uniref:CCHC-type domain-containing protein n=1 Tax=Beauveria bassiana TaxID=176275 RepID=A0A2N6NBG9_BEABA|nr:hypothetical protein BM221_009460 [Beauveria bassiana]
MTDQVVTHPGRTEEPQCYNCGGMGHWAVACPEPTRETPALKDPSSLNTALHHLQQVMVRIIRRLPYILHRTILILCLRRNRPRILHSIIILQVMGNNHYHPLRQAMDTIRLPLTLLLLSLTLPSSHGHRIRDHRKNTAVTPTQDKTAINSSHLGQLTADRTRKDLEVAISVIINGHSRLTETLHRHRQSLALFM